MNAFLLTRQWRDTVNGITLEFWFATETGPASVEVTGQEAVFFIRESESKNILNFLTSTTDLNASYSSFSSSSSVNPNVSSANAGVDKNNLENPQRHVRSLRKRVSRHAVTINASRRGKRLSPDNVRLGSATFKNYKNETVVPLYFKSYRAARDASQRLSEEHIPHWEVDVRPPERYLMERFVTGGVEIKSAVENTLAPLSGFNSFSNPKILPNEWRPIRNVSLKIISIDIETSMDASALYSVALFGASLSVVFMVGTKDDDNSQNNNAQNSSNKNINKQEQEQEQEPELVMCRDARDCFEKFIARLKQEDPDVLIGWNVVQFDFWVLETLSKKHNVRLDIGRNAQTCQWREDSDTGRRYLQMPGRIVLDGIELLRAAAYSFTSFSLENVAQNLLGDGKLLSGGDRGAEISELFLDDKMQLAKYNIKDCELVWDIFEQESLLEFAIERAHLTGLPMDRMGGSVASFDYAYMPLLHRKGYIAPNLGEQESNIVSPGGYVMNSFPGIFKNVLVLDFKSLYPSIIRTFNIDPYSYWYVSHNKNNHKLKNKNIIPGFENAVFSKDEYLLPDIIEKLWTARDKAKAEKNSPLSHAIKIIMNSFYGVLGSVGCRFYDPRVCSSITLRGHEIIQTTKEWIEKEGYQVIYGDTDSVFVWVGDDTLAEKSESIGIKLAVKLNNDWEENLRKRFDINSSLEIEFETHYSQFLMPTIRGSKEGSKKRYAGIIEKNGERKLIFKGLENVRTDWTVLAKQFQEYLYQRVFAGESVEEYVKNTVAEVLAGKRDDELIYRKRLRRQLDEYVKNVPPHVQAARKLLAWENKNTRRGEWIEYVITMNGPEPIDSQRSQINYEHYIEKQLQPVADGVLQFVNLSFAEITAAQLNLFEL